MSLVTLFQILAIVGAIIVVRFLSKKETGMSMQMGQGVSRQSSGKTPTLNMYGTDFTELARQKKIDPVIGRDQEILRLSQVLSRREKNNAILIGPPGVGKTAIVEGLAQRIVSGEVPEALQNKRLLALSVPSLLAGTKYRGEFEERAKKIVNEIQSAGRSIILFIDEVHSVIQSQGTEGSVNFADILKPALARGELQMVGATTTAEYEKYIKTDPSLERRFQPVEVHEPDFAEALAIVRGVADKFREFHKVEFTDAALEEAVSLTQKKIKNRKLPDKAIDAIDEAAAMVRVADVHAHIPAMLYSAAVLKNPGLADVWKEMQALDSKMSKSKKKPTKSMQHAKDTLENQIIAQGVSIVDSQDIQSVVQSWYT